MLVRNIGLTAGMVFALAVGCGGKAVIDGSGNNSGGSGGASVSSSSSASNQSSSSTGVPTCADLPSCCQQACEKGGEVGLACWPQNGNCGCQNLPAFQPDCEAALTALFACVANFEPFGYTCDASAGAVLVCGACDAEADEVEATCGGTQACQ